MWSPPEGMKLEPNLVAVTCHVVANHKRLDAPDAPRNACYVDAIRRIRAAGAQTGSYDYGLWKNTPQPLATLYAPKVYHGLGHVFYSIEDMGYDEHRRIVRWVLAQLVWDVDQDPMKLLKTFCDGFYGPAGGDVLRAMLLIDESVQNTDNIIMGCWAANHEIFTDELSKAGEKILRGAFPKVVGRQWERLRRFHDTFRMFAGLARCTRAIYSFYNERTEGSRQAALTECSDFAGFWARNSMSAIAPPDTCSRLMRRARGQVLGAPLQVEPKRAKNLEGVAQDQIVQEMFALAKVPEKLENLFLLPEVWKFRLDVLAEGEKRGWMKPDFDDRGWVELSTYNFFERQGFPCDGRFWYRVAFQAPAFPAGKRVFLRIGALDDDGVIYLNGKQVHRRWHLKPNDWQRSFEIDVTNAIQSGKTNHIAIRGNDQAGAGGLWRPCGLYTK